MARIRKEMKGGSQIKARAGSGKKKKEIDPTALEAQKLKMQELRRQKEERMRALLREKLAVEEKISRINRLKIQDHWRQVMRQVKVEDLRNVRITKVTHIQFTRSFCIPPIDTRIGTSFHAISKGIGDSFHVAPVLGVCTRE
eukprot:TRINITY_DN1680_c0_g1_i1.p1 TRINITY_DN1680_c0_g1~~TRINITY_DN1680_c0_g1_i1.p1  ORF type:complete len:142 (-),score=18.15 TRINITY_DN1680_c0_g1_i1:22-447(-)